MDNKQKKLKDRLDYTGIVTAGKPRKFPAIEYRTSAAETESSSYIRFIK